MGIKERAEKVEKAKLCSNCFNSGHRNTECKWSSCKKCGKKHNTLLHYERNDTNREKPTNSDSSPGPSTKSYSAMLPTQILLSTAMLDIKGKNGKRFQARVLLDSGSQSHFITKRFADLLNLPFKTVDLPVEGLNQLETRIRHSVNAEIHSRHNSYCETLEFLILPRICNHLPNHIMSKHALNIPRNITLADPRFHEPREIDALLGVEVFYDLLCIGQIEIPGHKARLHKTKLGWIISGKIGNNKYSERLNNCMLTLNSLDKSINRFWEIEEIENQRFLSEEEFQVEEHFKRHTKRDLETGRYIVRLPFNEKIEKLGESHTSAEKQFHRLERRLAKNTVLKSQYIEGMREAISLGHMVEIQLEEISKNHCFLPHHPVIKESSDTTKVRIVYNASSKTSTGISLNDCLKVGAVVQNSSFDIILRFRTHQIVMLADIEKMYKQIRLDKEDVQYQLILWRENDREELKTFCIPVVLFGCASAPHSATRVLLQLADDEHIKYPVASEVIKRDVYVDDIMTGADTIEKAKKLRDELIHITKEGGFTLRKWVSNCTEIVESMPSQQSHIDLFTSNKLETKALGVQWNRQTDSFTYNVRDEFDTKITKRSVLSNIARIYDPIGFLGPVIVSAKILMQQLWQCNTGWDESLPQNVYTAWMNIKQQLPKLNEIKFERKIIIKNAERIEIHGFCDASERAYGACCYIRSIGKNGEIFTNLFCSRNRIAPLKTISIPKLELCAALLLSRLIKIVSPLVNKRIDEIYLWSDSLITLQWINTQPYLLKTFVANRVSEIRDITKTMRWKHVPSELNIADALSRGQLPQDFSENCDWKSGPKWLQLDESKWPNRSTPIVPLFELKATTNLSAAVKPRLLIMKFSTISKMKRVMAYVLRFVNNSRKKKPNLSGHLAIQEINSALVQILKGMQHECFINDIQNLYNGSNVNSNSELKALSPFLDDNGLIRVGGRLKNSALDYSEKHPIVLPKNHHITQLLVQEQHIVHLHSGTQATLNAVRSRYWPINGKNTVKLIIRKCVICFRAKPRDYPYFMGNLPKNRITQTRPFLNAGIDYCGPFFIKEKRFRNRNKIKVYACIFICFVTKAVHIELVTDLTTDSFLGALRRFFARRGRSLNLYSDNATNFVGAKNEIEKFATLINSKSHNDTLTDFLVGKGINWHFSPPRSPHFGGLWEAAVKSFKYHYYRVIGDQLFTYEELQTYTTEIEAVLNSRPITPLSEDPNDFRTLTPAHFLIGDTFTSLPNLDISKEPVNRLSTWQHIQFIKQHFWQRWYKEYLNQLNTRTKWQQKPAESIKLGTMVLLKEDNTPPLHWPLGRISEVFPGDDGKVRVVTVKTQSGTFKRSITRVAPLPIEQ